MRFLTNYYLILTIINLVKILKKQIIYTLVNNYVYIKSEYINEYSFLVRNYIYIYSLYIF